MIVSGFIPTAILGALGYLGYLLYHVVVRMSWEGFKSDVLPFTPTLGVVIALLAIFNTRRIFKKQQAENERSRRIAKAIELRERFDVVGEKIISFASDWRNMVGYEEAYNYSVELFKSELGSIRHTTEVWFGERRSLLRPQDLARLNLESLFADLKGQVFEFTMDSEGRRKMSFPPQKSDLFERFRTGFIWSVKQHQLLLVNAIESQIRDEMGKPIVYKTTARPAIAKRSNPL